MTDSERKEDFRKKAMILALILLVAVKQLMVIGLPLYVIGDAGYDDRLMVEMAQHIASGQWLGPYSDMTLVKGWFFPLFLAVISRVPGLTFLTAFTLCYSLSCVILSIALYPAIKNRALVVLLAAFLIFNPMSTSWAVAQRLYRNGVTLFEVNLILAGYFGLFLRLKTPGAKRFIWALFAAAGLASLWNTREDAMWVLPFVVVVSVVLLDLTFRKEKEEDGEEKRYAKKSPNRVLLVIWILLPVLVLGGVNTGVSMLNEKMYGIRTVNELSGSHFADAMKAIYAVKVEEEALPHVSVSRKKRDVLYQISPSLAGMKGELEESLAIAEEVDDNPGDGETEDGWFFWGFRMAAMKAGLHESAQTADAFYAKVAEEIHAAADAGQVELQPVMPSALMSPWRDEYAQMLPEKMQDALVYMIQLIESESWALESTSEMPWRVYDAEKLTGDKALYDQGTNGYLSGWYLDLGRADSDAISLRIYQGEEDIGRAALHEASDINALYGAEVYAGRFEAVFPAEPGTSKTRYSLVIVDKQGKGIAKVPISYTGRVLADESRTMHIDYAYFPENRDGVLEKAEQAVHRANLVDLAYRRFSPMAAAFAAAVFAMMTILMLHKNTRKRLGALYLMALACAASLLVLLVGVSYTDISAFPAVYAGYLSGGYPLLFLFVGLMAIAVWRMTGGLIWETISQKSAGRDKELDARMARNASGEGEAVAVMKNIRCHRGRRLLKKRTSLEELK